MDLDIEMDVDDVQEVQPVPETYTYDIITGEEQEPGEIEDDSPANGEGGEFQSDQTVVPNKVHVRGLDTFNPEEVKAYLAEHYDAGRFDRVEWIDDSSANLVFSSESVAQDALVSLAEIQIADATQMPPGVEVRAKSFTGKPDSVLQVRFAVESDKKITGAAARSRFYLLHPEYDPEERRRRGDFTRKYRDRDDGRGRDRHGSRRRDREDDEPRNTFDVNLYDDDPGSLARRIEKPLPGARRRSRSRSRRHSVSSASTESDRIRSNGRLNREKELFPDRRPRSGLQSRNRSASPPRDRDGDAQMDVDDEARQSAALRSREKGRSIKERLSKDHSSPRELFPTKASTGVKELFPTKVSSLPEGKAQMDQVDDNAILSSAKLADRITSRGAAPSTSASASSFNIRGTANKRGAEQGFSIKGTGATVKELFPEKFGNAGKELFAEKLEGRGRRRQKAEDLFY